MSMLVREARNKDWKSVTKIMDQVQKMHIDWRPDIYKMNETIISEEDFAEIVKGDTFWVAEADGIVVGIMEILFRHVESPSQVTRDVIFIDTMAVDEPYRGKGVGHLFFEKVRQIKEEKHLDGIELQVNAKNKAAYEMYIHYGFTEKSINMELL